MNLRHKANKLAYIAGIAASVSLTSLVIAPTKAHALTSFFSSPSSFTNELTELQGSPLLTVSRYNPQTGQTVTEVRITLNASLKSEGTVTNTAPNAQSFIASTSIDEYYFTPSADAPKALSSIEPIFSTAINGRIGRQSYTAVPSNGQRNFGPFSISSNTFVLSFTNPTDIVGFLGTGTFSLEPTTGIFTSISGGGGNVRTNIQTFASANFTVEYLGNTVPVPFELSSNLGITAFAGTFLGFSWWKRQRHLKSSKV